ncbi:MULTISPECIES: YcjF family protein [Prochlorococcus]|uniref:YcjF family protein n=1 Tax=Prochlorococcus TaxID=1218 RepID=UPI0005338CAD|nr:MULTISPECIES: YcjF family protein [Prochlorococcus]KGG12296.1 Membrane associated GTPase [Prochlorococcus sp. MIT 0601]
MKILPSSPVTIPSLPAGKVGFVLGGLIFTEWAINDLIHLPAGGLAVIAAGAGIWFLTKQKSSNFNSPSSVKGWVDRCKDVLAQFEELEEHEQFLKNNPERILVLEQILKRDNPQKLCLLGTNGVELPEIESIQSSINESNDLNLSFFPSLPIQASSWEIPEQLFKQDALIYNLPLPLRAVDLLWLKNIPDDQPAWIMITWKDADTWDNHFKALISQLPERWANRILKYNGDRTTMKDVLRPVRRFLDHPSKNIDLTRQRLLSKFHTVLQSHLEQIRREKFKAIQNRSQWLVAGAVFASPVPSTDLLAVAVVNGLMIQEMGKLWSCNIQPDLLKVVAKQLAIAALAQGVVEWSGQALLGFAKLHGGTWIAAGTMQSLSAAYLTRVVGRSMADWMALNNGVSKLDLDSLKLQAPELVSKAAESEKVDWSSFMTQANNWLKDQIQEPISQLNPS